MLELREKEILSTLEKLKDLQFVLIGGYAVNAYTQPRFSVDCDIVVLDNEDALKLINLLEQEGYKKKETNQNIPYSEDFICLVKRLDDYSIPFDILISQVVDRKTKSKFSAEWIFNNSEIRILPGKANPVRIELRIINPEALIIMKLAAGRKSDFRDVFMLLGGKINLDYILSELKRYGFLKNLKEFKQYVLSDSYKDNLQGVFGKLDEKIFGRIIEKVKNL